MRVHRFLPCPAEATSLYNVPETPITRGLRQNQEEGELFILQWRSRYWSVLLRLDTGVMNSAHSCHNMRSVMLYVFLFSVWRGTEMAAAWTISVIHELISTALRSILTTIMLLFFYFDTSHWVGGSIRWSTARRGHQKQWGGKRLMICII